MAAVNDKGLDDGISDMPPRGVNEAQVGAMGGEGELENGRKETEFASVERVEAVYRYASSLCIELRHSHARCNSISPFLSCKPKPNSN
jgi:hypothetical protein